MGGSDYINHKDEKFDVIYTNERIKREEWHKFSVGETKFNDDAVRRAGACPVLLLHAYTRFSSSRALTDSSQESL